ncbi:MAG: hypothetical protein VX757_03555, partial [Planctomycetota bacterium]|nr:hypothetical protein [Planctomycetota bacterium]
FSNVSSDVSIVHGWGIVRLPSGGGREDLDRVQARGVARPDGKESSPKGGAIDSVFLITMRRAGLKGESVTWGDGRRGRSLE